YSYLEETRGRSAERWFARLNRERSERSEKALWNDPYNALSSLNSLSAQSGGPNEAPAQGQEVAFSSLPNGGEAFEPLPQEGVRVEGVVARLAGQGLQLAPRGEAVALDVSTVRVQGRRS